MRGLEALHDAIQHQEGWFPGSRSNANRNPGNLRGSSHVTHTMDTGKYAVFASVVDGSKALIALVNDYGSGHIRDGMTWDSTLNDMFNIWAPPADHNAPHVYAVNVAHWCSQALGKPLTHSSTLREVCADLFEEVPHS
jgi:hypothetical protein